MNTSNRPILYVLQYGFSFDNSYWNNFIQTMELKHISCIDIDNEQCLKNTNIYMFLNEADLFLEFLQQDILIIGIGHSLGFIKLECSVQIMFDAIIGLQAFCNFCGYNEMLRIDRVKILNDMIALFKKRPSMVIENFQHSCGVVDSHYDDEYNYIDDFAMLTKSFDIRVIPTLIIGAHNDQVVSHDVIIDNFGQMQYCICKFINHDKHNFGIEKNYEIKKIIMEFLYDSL